LGVVESNSSDGVEVRGPASAAAPSRNESRLAQPDSHSAPANESGSGGVYQDPQGYFSVNVAPGWAAKTQSGCYGPSDRCPSGATGVNLFQGKNFAFIAPFSVQASQPSDVVRIVAGEYQSEFRNFRMVQNEPSQLDGLDVALGTFTGIDPNGVSATLYV